ncbi:MAG: FHIPEP family type III secretion protein, partial [Vallitaleaceae bacterium]|nr:FHIPEP family type III secretion protein [Vallitaleaceae bacterium]
ILVTKVSKDADVSDTLVAQLFAMPKVLYFTGAVLILLGLVTPLNDFIVSGTGLLVILAARNIDKTLRVEAVKQEISTEDVAAEETRKPENVVSLLQVDPIELEFGYGIIPLADVSQGGDLLDRVVMIRRQIALELGTIVPIIRLRDNIQLNPNQYIIKIKGTRVADGEILFDHYMAMNPGYVEEEIDGIETIEPAFKLPALWISEAQRERAETLGYTVVDPPSIIATHLTEVIKMNLGELLTRQNVQTLINTVKENNQTLIDELVPKQLNVGEIQKILMNLLRESISIRDLVTIFETVADHASVTRDPDVLTEYVRQALKRAISAKYFEDEDSNQVITLDPAIEQTIMEAVKHTEQGTYLALRPDMTQKILTATQKEITKLTAIGRVPIILTSPIVRVYYKRMTQDEFQDLIVLSFNELDSNVELQSVGMVSVN